MRGGQYVSILKTNDDDDDNDVDDDDVVVGYRIAIERANIGND